jgi:plastocyanin
MYKRLSKTGLALLMAGAAALVAAGCAGNSAGDTTPAPVPSHVAVTAGTQPQHPNRGATQPENVPNQVTIDNFRFSPSELTVAVGTKVTWVNHDDVPHTATSTTKPRTIDSGTLDTDDKFSKVFTTPGTYEYFCAVHPHMKGQIVVK